MRIKESIQQLQAQGPGYCRIAFIRKGNLYVINEGMCEVVSEEQGQAAAVPFCDQRGNYRVGTCLTRDGFLIHLSEQILQPDTRANFLAVLLRSIPDYFNLDDGELRVVTNVKLSSEADGARDSKQYIFIYGHDESGLVPFERIFEHLSKLLTKHLQVLESCTCDDGCYHCLFSFNSQYLIGILSRQQAATFLHAYLQLTLLHPHLMQKPVLPTQNDLVLKVEWKGRCEVTAANQRSNTIRQYTSGSEDSDQNTAIYTTINNALKAEAINEVRSVKIVCRPSYIDEQLQGKAKVIKGREAFFHLMLTLRSWDTWTSERGK